MDSLIIERKLDSLQRSLARVTQKCPPDVHTLLDDADLQDIVVLNLSRAVQLCVDIGTHCLTNHPALSPPNTMGETFDRLAEAGVISDALGERMKKPVGFRNLAVHNYAALDMAIVHAIATRHVEDFRQFAQAVAAA